MTMPDAVLFSPIGMTDPARNNYDGPFLHILRYYKPKKAVLYFTKETWELHEHDNRYLAMADRMCKRYKFQTSFELIGDKTLEDAHQFEIFDAPFREALQKLRLENPHSDILVNISSGTPQMEASLYMLKATLPFPIKTIQVTSPTKGANIIHPFDSACFDTLEDGKPGAKERHLNVHCENARFTLLRRNIEQFIERHDYRAALQLTKGSEDWFSEDFLCLLRAADERLSLHTAEARARLSERFAEGEYSPVAAWFEESSPELTREYEYLLALGTLVRRGAYGDFARAFSPALMAVMRITLLRRAGVDMLALCDQPSPGEYLLNPDTVREKNPEWFTILNSTFRDGFYARKDLSAFAMLNLLDGLRGQNGEIITEPKMAQLKRLRKFEGQVRNKAAHQIVPITNNDICAWMTQRGRLGESAEQIYGMLRDAFAYASGKEYQWNGYEQMNTDLKIYAQDEMR